MPKLPALVAAAFLAGSGAAAAGCLPTQPETVSLSGALERVTFAGPPNYESVRAGDRPETYFVLRLPRAICAHDAAGAHIAAMRVQLFLAPAQYNRFRPRLGHSVTLPGQLWPAETGHHHTPLMFTPAVGQDGR